MVNEDGQTHKLQPEAQPEAEGLTVVGTVGERPDVSVKVTTSNADVVIRQGK